MRILILTMDYVPSIGGAQKYVSELVKHLTRKGHEVLVVANLDSPELPKREIREGVKLIRIKFPPWYTPARIRNLLISLLRIGTASFTISRIVKEYSPDIIHCHFAYPPGICGILGAKFLRRPVIITLLGADVFTSKEVNYGVRRSILGEFMIRRSIKHADLVLAPNKALYNAVINMASSKNKIKCINACGIDTGVFKPQKSDKGRKIIEIRSGYKPIILAVARLDRVKGLNFLIQAACDVLRHYPNARFIICGDGTERENLENLAKRLGIKKSVLFTGFISSVKDLAMYYAAADIFVLPSIMEAGSLTILEALASEKTVVASRVGGIPTIIENGKNGMLFKAGDPKDLARCILNLLKNPDLALSMGREGRKLVVREYSWEVVIEDIINEYEEILGLAGDNYS